MRHIALEGRCFVFSACQFTRRSDYPAEIEPAEVARGKYDFDETGHYAPPDVFRLMVNEKAQPAVQTNAPAVFGLKDDAV